MKILSGKPLGPGPGNYKLPTLFGYPAHDASKYRNPMYSFGYKPDSKFVTLGPGPTYKVDEWTETGHHIAPQWSFGYKLYRDAASKTPGPGAHAPERCPEMRVARAPAYTIAPRLDLVYNSVGPGPSAYNTRGKTEAPAFSLRDRTWMPGKPQSPGPGIYFQRDMHPYMTRAPLFSLGARLTTNYSTKSPGPAAYTGNLYNFKKRLPLYSFGIIHFEFAPPYILEEDEYGCGYNCHD